MTNNYVIRRTKIIFGLNAPDMVDIFALAEVNVSTNDIKGWARKDDDPELVPLKDQMLASFLNGLIIKNRGKKDNAIPVPEDRLNNNIILRKYKIALNLKDDDIVDVFKLAGINLGKAELSSFFRNYNHKNYRLCKDQFLRNFFHGLQEKHYDGPKVDSKRYTKKEE